MLTVTFISLTFFQISIFLDYYFELSFLYAVCFHIDLSLHIILVVNLVICYIVMFCILASKMLFLLKSDPISSKTTV